VTPKAGALNSREGWEGLLNNSIDDRSEDWTAHPDAITGRGMVIFDPTRVLAAMERAGIDLLMPHTIVNAAYLADYYFYDFPPFYTTEAGLPYMAFVGYPGDTRVDAFLVAHTGGNAMDLGDHDPWIKDRYLFGPTEPRALRVEPARSARPVSQSAVAAAASAIADRGMTGARIGVELPFLGVTVLERLQAALPSVTFVDGTPVLEECRLVKTPEELRRIQVAAEGSRLIHLGLSKQLREGLTGYEIDRLIKLAGAEHNRDLEFREIHPNRNGVLRFCPSSLEVMRGESIVIDVGTRYLGYTSDMAHNHSVGEPDPSVLDLHRRVRTVFEEVVALLRPGIAAGEVGRHGLRRLRELDVPMAYNLVGHGIGRVVHEAPVLAPENAQVIEEDMVVAVEIPIFVPGVGAVQIEENYAITKGGARWLAPSTLDILMTQ
jgi:Xaa-Pro dipeptidase